jgi:hypothetical protein
MGTDITWVIEAQDDSGAWRFVDVDPDIYRNYQAFYALSGIRDDVVKARGFTQEPFFEPRHELPPDASAALREMAEDEGHPWDYRTLAELLAHDWTWTESNIVDIFEKMKQLGPLNKVRAIWWFDS